MDSNESNAIRELKMDFRIKYLESFLKNYLEDALEQHFQKIKNLDQAKDPYLTISGIAQRFQVTKATIHNWIKRGTIVGKKLGKNRYFSEEEVKNALSAYGWKKHPNVLDNPMNSIQPLEINP